MTAALEGDKASAEALAKKGNLLTGEKALAAVANFRIAQRLSLLRSCEMAQKINVPTQIGSVVSPKVLESEISSVLLAQKEVLAGRGRKIDSHNALMIGNVISQTAAASNSIKLNKKGPKIEP